MSIKVAVAGATGNLGIPVVKAILTADYPVTVLTRKGSGSISKLPQSPNISVVQVDYSSATSLTEALKGHAVLISTLASAVNTGSGAGQIALVDAAIAAGVERYIPSEFGSDTTNPNTSQLPVFKDKVETLKHLEAAVAANPSFSYTILYNGSFFDWGLAHSTLVDPRHHTATLFDGGDIPISVTNLDTVGQAVVGILKHLSETANRRLYIQDAQVSQNQLIRYAKEKDGVEWTVTHKSTEKTKEESYAELAKGANANPFVAMFGFINVSVFGGDYGGDFSSRLDNHLLGLKGLGEGEIRKQLEEHLP
ncbi:uncharacterized protein Z520_04694 [Fonsecaea multimorphosa CBS 102226]|uniref:NmrA-like domain-containing protein n=1 Tax=Fonsecaea multimorphosa CBS 102226 TaxID=1442371 RepID=A0A0D2KQX5_9EURO|nr:uncharacterized protein Z520_04694 [Fonsecaea multimorphosa CBS 102226]KIX99118.1 hypothetical protein Z520_04694 [Fonsecaea multimorphosa CBS 102226]OAL26029.1 hypothetical protein AYO22_04443 [Fonsecaea multimorphosa]